jgi:hypothetical protein
MGARCSLPREECTTRDSWAAAGIAERAGGTREGAHEDGANDNESETFTSVGTVAENNQMLKERTIKV